MAQITKSNIAQIRADVEAALKTIYAKHGVDISVGRIVYNENQFRCKIEGNVRGANAAAPVTPKAAALKNALWLLPNTFDETKKYRVGSLGPSIVVGYNSRARQYPFIVKQVSTGKSYKVSQMSLRMAIEAGAL